MTWQRIQLRYCTMKDSVKRKRIMCWTLQCQMMCHKASANSRLPLLTVGFGHCCLVRRGQWAEAAAETQIRQACKIVAISQLHSRCWTLVDYMHGPLQNNTHSCLLLCLIHCTCHVPYCVLPCPGDLGNKSSSFELTQGRRMIENAFDHCQR